MSRRLTLDMWTAFLFLESSHARWKHLPKIPSHSGFRPFIFPFLTITWRLFSVFCRVKSLIQIHCEIGEKESREKFPSENFHLAVLEWTGKKTEYLLKLMEIHHSTRWSLFIVEFHKSHSFFFAIAEQLSRFLLELVSSLAVEEEIYIFITFSVVERRKGKRDDKKWAAANVDGNLFTTRRLKRNCGGGWGLSNLNIWDGKRLRGKIQISRLNQ